VILSCKPIIKCCTIHSYLCTSLATCLCCQLIECPMLNFAVPSYQAIFHRLKYSKRAWNQQT
jgi:hypothetical protein